MQHYLINLLRTNRSSKQVRREIGDKYHYLPTLLNRISLVYSLLPFFSGCGCNCICILANRLQVQAHVNSRSHLSLTAGSIVSSKPDYRFYCPATTICVFATAGWLVQLQYSRNHLYRTRWECKSLPDERSSHIFGSEIKQVGSDPSLFRGLGPTHFVFGHRG